MGRLMPDIVQTTGWWEEYFDSLTPGYAELIADEDKAVRMYSFNHIVNGLLQTEEYARAVIAGPLPVDASMTGLFEVRMKRQWKILERENPPEMEVLLDESVLYRQIGGPAVLRDQLKHLLVMSELDHVTIRVIPFALSQYLHAFDTHMYAFDTREAQGTVYLEEIYGMNKQEGHVVFTYYKNIFAQLRRRALDEEATRKRIKRAIRELEIYLVGSKATPHELAQS